jgi:uncharacterized membrane protein YqgA involved in biofilm formation
MAELVIPVGTLVNTATVLTGGTIGLLLGRRFPEGVRELVFQGLGLCTLTIGMSMALKMLNPLILIFSVLIGGIAGEIMGLEDVFHRLGERLKARVKSSNAQFTDGLITAFLLFCIGSLTILGAFDEGLRGDPTLLYTKAMLDGFASIALASTFGAGVLFSVIPLFAYQYGLTLFASFFSSVFTEAMITELTAVGGVLILGLGINLLKLRYIKVSNLLPALVVVVILSWFFG